MIANKYLKLLRQHKRSSGFTLVELLVSSVIGILVIGAAGYGMMNLLRYSRGNTAQSQKRTEFNRALEFISDEMRQADTIDVDPTTAFGTASGSGGAITPPPNAQPVLSLNIPDLSEPVIYFVSSPSSGDASVWNGPRVIYRYGPTIDSNGNLDDSSWTVEPLVDGISADTVTPSCGSLTASPSSSPVGFYACIQPIAATDDPDTPINETEKGETAKLFAIGKLDDANSASDNYQADSQVYTRAEEEDLSGVDPDKTYDGRCIFGSGGALICPPGSGGGSRTYSIERVSDSFACKEDGTKWKVKVTAYYIDAGGTEQYFNLADGSGNSQNVDLSTTSLNFVTDQNPRFRVTPDTSNSPGCSSGDPAVFTSAIQNQSSVDSSNTNQFKLLEDADIIPAQLKYAAYTTSDPANTQQSALEILNNESLIDPNQDNKVNTGNDYLVAFEIGQTDSTKPGYDFQDQMFLINVE